MTKFSVSDTYLDGIRDGRALHKMLTKDQGSITIEEMERIRDGYSELIRNFGQPIKDHYKGNRDFWTQKIKEAKRCTTFGKKSK